MIPTRPDPSSLTPDPCRSGIVLILLSGVVALLLFLSLLFLWMGRHLASSASATVRSAETTLCAAAGMDYAAARLSRSAYPVHSTVPADRGDDWAFREGIGAALAGAANPSFSHGEGWADVASGLARAGAYDAGIDSVAGIPDRDGDGRFSAWSGRVRGGGGPFRLRFSLKVDSLPSKVSVNCGALDALNRNGGTPAVPDHRDPSLHFHRGLAHLINNLATLRRPGTAGWFRRVDAAAGVPLGTHVFGISWMGDDLLSARPQGGYRSMKEVRTTLKLLGYADADCDAVLPDLSVGTPVPVGEGGRPLHSDPTDAATYYEGVELASAGKEILQALWMHLAANSAHVPYGQRAAWAVKDPNSGLAFDDDTILVEPDHNIVILRDEAGLLADHAISLRNAGEYAPKRLYERFVAESPSVFAAEFNALNGAGYALEAKNRVRLKADLAFQAIAPGLLPAGTPTPLANWGIDLPGGTSPFYGFDPTKMSRILYPDASGAWPVSGKDPFQIPNVFSQWQLIRPMGLSFLPPHRYAVESSGASTGGPARLARSLSGVLDAIDALGCFSQEDFESLHGRNLSARGLAALPPVHVATDDEIPDLVNGGTLRRTYPQVVSIPAYNQSRDPARSYSRGYGGLMLASRETGLQGAALYYPFAEDPALDGNSANDNWSEGPGPPYQTPLTNPAHPLAVQFFGPQDFPDPWKVFAPPLFPSHTYIDAFTLEGWLHLTPEWSTSELGIRNIYTAGTTEIMEINVRGYSHFTGGKSYARIELYCWPGGGTVPMPLIDVPLDQTGEIHVVVTAQRYLTTPPSAYTYFRLFVNGKNYGGVVAEYRKPWQNMYNQGQITGDRSGGGGPKNHKHRLRLNSTDEIRMYDRVLDPHPDPNDPMERPPPPDETKKRWQLGRHPLPPADPASRLNPAFRSPLYDLRYGGLRNAMWTLLTNAQIARRVGVRVTVRGYNAAGMQIWARPVADSLLEDLGGLPAVRFFDYLVEFTNADPADASALYETPVFGGIWLTFQRQGVNPWTSWSVEGGE